MMCHTLLDVSCCGHASTGFLDEVASNTSIPHVRPSLLSVIHASCSFLCFLNFARLPCPTLASRIVLGLLLLLLELKKELLI